MGNKVGIVILRFLFGTRCKVGEGFVTSGSLVNCVSLGDSWAFGIEGIHDDLGQSVGHWFAFDLDRVFDTRIGGNGGEQEF